MQGIPLRTTILLVAALGASACSRAVRQTEPPEVRFVVWGDSQFNHPDVFERLVHETELLRPQFVIQVGDLIQGYSHSEAQLREEWRRYAFQTAPLTAPFFPVPGNHDVITPESHALYGEVWGADRYTYSFDAGPVHSIVLDTYWPGESDTIAPWQREWLAEDLRQYAARNGGEGSEELARRSIFVYMHSPIFKREDDWRDIHELLRRYPVRMVVGGHTHEYVWDVVDGITYVVINSSGKMGRDVERGGLFHQFLHVSVREGDVRAAVVKAGSILPLDTVSKEERASVPRLAIPRRSIRLPLTDRASAFEDSIKVMLDNPLDQPRTYRLEWQVPRHSPVAVGPAELWVDLDAKASQSLSFNLRMPAGTTPEQLPVLAVSATESLRTGVVPRKWETKYRQDLAEQSQDPSIRTTSIALDSPLEFRTEWPLFLPPVARAVSVDPATIRIDGVLDEAAWERAVPVDRFTTPEGGEPGTATEVRFLYDEQGLYVGARMEEPNPAGMQLNAGPPVPLTWSDDDFELFLDAAQSQSRFVRLFQNAAGTRFNSWPINTPDNLFESTYASAVKVGADHWILEMHIPWKECGTDSPARPGTQWNVNIWRHRQQGKPARQEWSTMGNFPYEPARFGLLLFD